MEVNSLRLIESNSTIKFIIIVRETNEPPTESCIPLTGIYKCTAKNIEGQDLVYQELGKTLFLFSLSIIMELLCMDFFSVRKSP